MFEIFSDKLRLNSDVFIIYLRHETLYSLKISIISI